jgi:hypothetical protein
VCLCATGLIPTFYFWLMHSVCTSIWLRKNRCYVSSCFQFSYRCYMLDQIHMTMVLMREKQAMVHSTMIIRDFFCWPRPQLSCLVPCISCCSHI